MCQCRRTSGRTPADPEFGSAGGRVHPLPPSRCPRVAALLSTLASQGLVSVVGGDANAEVFVKWKSERKCALIVNMKMFNKGCRYKYAFLCVPFGWHQAPGLVHALISDLLGDLGRGGVVVVQYLDDILFVGHDPGEVAAVTDSAAHLLRRAGFIISEKSVFTPQRPVRWMGKDVDLSGRRVAPAAPAVAAVVAAWVRLALKPYTYVVPPIVPPRGLQILWLIVVKESWSAVQEGAGRCRAGRAHAKTTAFCFIG